MLHISKGQEPEFLSKFKRSNPHKTYDSIEFRPYHGKLNEILRKEQKGLCAYCCGKLAPEKSHNEHIEPQHPKGYTSHRSLDYNNIVASCNSLSTCGKKKDNNYDAKKFISPLDTDCETKFDYGFDGSIEGDEYTITLLNLDGYELRNARKAVIRQLQMLDKDTIEFIYMNSKEEKYQPYYNVIKWYYNSL